MRQMRARQFSSSAKLSQKSSPSAVTPAASRSRKTAAPAESQRDFARKPVAQLREQPLRGRILRVGIHAQHGQALRYGLLLGLRPSGPGATPRPCAAGSTARRCVTRAGSVTSQSAWAYSASWSWVRAATPASAVQLGHPELLCAMSCRENGLVRVVSRPLEVAAGLHQRHHAPHQGQDGGNIGQRSAAGEHRGKCEIVRNRLRSMD